MLSLPPFTSHPPAGGMHKNGIKQLLREFCDGATKRYVDQHLKLRYQVGLGVWLFA
jgi:hypothetical protein